MKLFNRLYKFFTGKQRLGPNQKKWLEALRSGEYDQHNDIPALHNKKDGITFCCLGVACEVAPQEGVQRYGPQYGHTCEGRIQGSELEGFQQETLHWLAMHREGEEHCINMNDSLKATFREIADAIELHPQKYFNAPA